ncbi:hypothetical protein PTKIN_Ptkin19aG0098000 [Pterospermum kingtungense]
MGRSPCCAKEGLNRGAWTALEDEILTAYIKAHGEGQWRNLPKKAGLKRCGKSCRLRWLNYLRPDIKRGNISHDEEELIIRLHKLLGNRWSLIAGRLPGRTDNEIKNYWNTTLGKKAKAQASSSLQSTEIPSSKSRQKKLKSESEVKEPETKIQVIRTKATRCSSKVMVPLQPSQTDHHQDIDIDNLTVQKYPKELQDCNQEMDNSTGGVDQGQHGTEVLDFLNFGIDDDDHHHQLQESIGEAEKNNDMDQNPSEDPLQFLSLDEDMYKDWTSSPCLDDNATMNLDSLAFLLDSNEWLYQGN